MKKTIRTVLWVVGVTVAVAALLSAVAGPVAKGYVNRHGEQLTGRRVEVEHVGLNLLTGRVAVRGITLYEDDGTSVFAGFDTLDVRAALLQLPFRTVNLRHITLAGLHANLIQDGDRFNFSSLVDHFADSGDKDKDTTPSQWTLKFRNIRLNHARLAYSDRRSNKGIALPDVNLRVPGFVIGGKEHTEGGLNISFADGGRLGARAHYNADDGSYSAVVDIDGFDLRNIEGYVQDFMAIDRLGGNLTAHITASGNTDALLGSRIGAKLALADVALRADGRTLAGLRTLDIDVGNIDLGNNSYDIGMVHLDGLEATYEQWDGYSNISRLLVGTDAAATDTTPDEAPRPNPMRLRLGRLLLENSTLTYANHTLPDDFRFALTNLTVKADNLTLDGDNSASLRASLPGGGHMAVRWQGCIDNWKRHQDIFLTVKGLDMRQLSPWTVAYTGQPVEDGVFGLTSRNSIDNSILNGQNTIDIYNPTVGKRRKDIDDARHLPLKTALYVLKDKDGKVLLDVPVAGNIDSPEFNYMKLLWKTLGNLLVKVATSPARALGNALGLGNDGLDFIAMEPDQHSLTSEQYHILGQLASIAQSDSLLVLHLEQRMPATDSDSVAHRYERRNGIVRGYLLEQGVDPERLTVTTGEPVAGKERTGYAVSSDMIIDE